MEDKDLLELLEKLNSLDINELETPNRDEDSSISL